MGHQWWCPLSCVNYRSKHDSTAEKIKIVKDNISDILRQKVNIAIIRLH